ncbi:hypothetical protein HBB16_10280 [Pseudonocardia sp. MCCB 268]|nr:hypothetical protein [Pseudonocardia cytotoxica]
MRFRHDRTGREDRRAARPPGRKGSGPRSCGRASTSPLESGELGDPRRRRSGTGPTARSRGRPPPRTRIKSWPTRGQCALRRRGSGSTCSSCTSRTATWCRASCPRCPTGAPDDYGGSLENRARLGLGGILDAVREVWPADKPDQRPDQRLPTADDGFDGDDAVALAPMLPRTAPTSSTSPPGRPVDAKPAYGRLYQTPFADRIRQETGVPTITVGAVSSVEDANTIIAGSGRADLCADVRPHLVDPYWTMNAALTRDYRGHLFLEAVPVRASPAGARRRRATR